MVDKSSTVGPGVVDALYMFCAYWASRLRKCVSTIADNTVYSFNYGPKALGLLQAGNHVGDWEARAALPRWD